jgi:hypothetical protein
MARVKYSSIINELSGSLGHATFQQGQAGSIVRSKPNPGNPYSNARYNIKNYIIQCQQAWRHLTAYQKQGYINYASYSPIKQNHNSNRFLTGYLIFLKYNLVRLQCNFAILEDVAYATLQNAEPGYNVYMSAGYLYIEFNFELNHYTRWAMIKVTKPLAPGVNYFTGQTRVIPLPIYDIRNFVISAPYIAAYGFLPSPGDRVGLEVDLWSPLGPMFLKPFRQIETV